MLNRLLIKVFIIALLVPNKGNTQESSFLEINCNELFNDILSHYNSLESLPFTNDWIAKSIQKSEGSIAYEILIGNLNDTLITINITSIDGQIQTFKQFINGNIVGLNIHENKITSKNPHQWETFKNLTNALMISDKNPYILFAFMLRPDYIDYHKIQCVTEKELMDRLFHER